MTSDLSRGQFRVVSGYVAAEQCRSWQKTLLENRDRWVRRFSFYTYGRAWYADIETGNLPSYHASATAANALVDRLSGFKAAMVSAAELLAAPHGEGPLRARPRRENLGPYWCDTGLHVLGDDCRKGGVAHVDLEGLSPYPETMFDHETRAFSAVLSVSAPAEGGDLLVWPQRRYLASDPQDEGLPPDGKPERLPCQAGSLLLFDSFLCHQVDRFRVSSEHPWRTTGIVHFLYRDTPEPHWEYWF